MSDRYQRPQLRYKRFGGGYRREDVEFALAELRLTLCQLDNDLESLRDRNRELEGELATARSEIESFRAKEHELWQTMSAALRRAGEIEEGATERARVIVAQAEEEALRIRSEASRRIEDSKTQFNELLRLKDNLLDAMRSVVGDFGHAISRVERGEQLLPGVKQDVAGEARPEPVQEAAAPAEPWAAPAGPAPAEPSPAPPFVPPVQQAPPAPPAERVVPEPVPAAPAAPQPDTVSIPAAPPPPSPSPEPEPQPLTATPPPPQVTPPPVSPPVSLPPMAPPPPAAPEEPVFETRLELDAGPFSDFAALSAFERELARLPKVEDVYVRRVADDRALIELTLSEVAPLLRTMRESLPYELEVRSASRSKIVVNVSVQTAAGTR